MKERFVVGSVTGWSISGTGGYSPSGRKSSSIWYVYDSAYCYRPIAVFRYGGAEERAREGAARLNAPRRPTQCVAVTKTGIPCQKNRMSARELCNIHAGQFYKLQGRGKKGTFVKADAT